MSDEHIELMAIEIVKLERNIKKLKRENAKLQAVIEQWKRIYMSMQEHLPTTIDEI